MWLLEMGVLHNNDAIRAFISSRWFGYLRCRSIFDFHRPQNLIFGRGTIFANDLHGRNMGAWLWKNLLRFRRVIGAYLFPCNLEVWDCDESMNLHSGWPFESSKTIFQFFFAQLFVVENICTVLEVKKNWVKNRKLWHFLALFWQKKLTIDFHVFEFQSEARFETFKVCAS